MAMELDKSEILSIIKDTVARNVYDNYGVIDDSLSHVLKDWDLEDIDTSELEGIVKPFAVEIIDAVKIQYEFIVDTNMDRIGNMLPRTLSLPSEHHI